MAPVTCFHSQALSSCLKQQAILCRESPSCSLRPFLVPSISSSLSSFLAAPNETSSSLFLKRLSYGTYLCARQSSIPSHAKSGSSFRKLLQRLSVRSAHSENGVWKSAGENGQQKRRVIAKANDSTADEPQSSEMSLENALKLLGVGEGASFEEILKAKKVMMDRSGGDQEQVMQVEAAYDMLLMQSLSQRRSGKVLNSAVRYADVRKPKSSSSGVGPEWMQKALKSAPVSLQTPSTSELGTQSALFAALIIWTFATGAMSSSNQGAATGQDTPGFILAIGFGLAIFFLRKQNIKLGKASLITIGGLVSGALLGGLVESWLRVDIVPVLGIGSPAIVVSEFVLFSLWFSSLYLR